MIAIDESQHLTSADYRMQIRLKDWLGRTV